MTRRGAAIGVFGFLFGATALFPLSSLVAVPGAGAAYHVGFAFLVLLFVALSARTTTRGAEALALWLPLAAALALSVAFSVDRPAGATFIFSFFLRGGLAAIVFHLFYERDEASRLLSFMTGIAGIAALNGIGERLAGANWPFDAFYRAYNADYIRILAVRGGGVLGTVGHPVAYGTFLALFVPVALSRRSMALRLASVVLLFGVVASVSRAALLSSGVGVLVLAMLWPWQRPVFRWAAPILVLLLGFAGLAGLRHAVGGDHFRLGLSAETQRLGAYRMTMSVLRAHPLLGIGPGRFLSEYESLRTPEMLAEIATPDNQYLRWAIETGLAGIAALLWMLFISIARLVAKRGSADGRAMAGCVGGIAGGCAAFFFFDGFLWLPTQLAFWSLVGLGLAAASSDATPQKR